ncbi:MAG: ribonuclease P protein component [Deltaproteobacteria bacterium]|nr:MAG: ribonuclease P protein component [Deltaproteobacteria bacterium]
MIIRPLGLPPRLQGRPSFVRVQGGGRRHGGKFVVLLAAAGTGGIKVGYTVSRKVGGAVVRNLVRRRLREIIRHHQHILRPSCELVIIAYARAKTATFAALQRDVVQQLGRLGAAELPTLR